MPARKRTRVVVDVNVLISALIKADHISLQQLFNKQRYTVLVSDTLLEEFERVSGRARLRKHFTTEGATRALHRIRGLSEYVKADPPFTKICRDEKDDYLLALAKAAKADLLITGDADLLVLEKYGRTRIIKPAVFKREFL
jgi:uncharacterized protein